MRRSAGILGTLLLAVLALGCEADDPTPRGGAAVPASLADLLGGGGLDPDAVTVRDALLQEIAERGGVRAVVRGGESATTVELDASSDLPLRAARRYSWVQDGTTREVIQLPHGRVCVNRATGRAVRAWGNAATGWIQASARPYSCTEPGSTVGALVVQGLRPLDPVIRLGSFVGRPGLADLGTETDEDGVPTRHLRMEGAENGTSEPTVPTSHDLWVDDELRLVRAEFSGLDEASGPYSATFSYERLRDVRLPPAADRGLLVFRPGVGAGSQQGSGTRAPE
ncbi:hypothetical protein [Nocardioides ochotonae]|uniref:hypothetical protein n=1 Tax=Nocardioides ochotonae TaxID=2685869 RepID=UPI0014082638|nr:hypothetical protein [Nocardioides ochotonae]